MALIPILFILFQTIQEVPQVEVYQVEKEGSLRYGQEILMFIRLH
jgi:hypothetical protein